MAWEVQQVMNLVNVSISTPQYLFFWWGTNNNVIDIPCISYSASPPDSTVPGVAGETRESGTVEACIIDGCVIDGCVAEVCVVRTVSAVSMPVDEDTGPGPGEAGPLAYIHSAGRFLGSASAASASASADSR